MLAAQDSVRCYLKSISRVPLLNAEQEIEYGKAVQQMLETLHLKSALAEELRREPTLAEWATRASLDDCKLMEIINQGQCARDNMLQANLRLVVKIAKEYQGRGLEFLDLIQEGAIGLSRAVDKFDPTRGYKFSTYAYWWIRQSISRALAQKSRPIRLPVHITETLNAIKRTRRQYLQQFGRYPNINELAIALEKTPQQIERCLQVYRPVESLSRRVGTLEDTEVCELIEDPARLPQDQLLQTDLRTTIIEALRTLNPQQQQVVIMRFGLDNGVSQSLEQISAKLHVSRERVRQIEKKALNKCRQIETLQKYCQVD